MPFDGHSFFIALQTVEAITNFQSFDYTNFRLVNGDGLQKVQCSISILFCALTSFNSVNGVNLSYILQKIYMQVGNCSFFFLNISENNDFLPAFDDDFGDKTFSQLFIWSIFTIIFIRR